MELLRSPTLVTAAIAGKFPYLANPRGLRGIVYNITNPLKQPGGLSLSNTECCHLLLAAQLPLEDGLGNENRCKHIGHQANHQRYREALHRPGAEQEQHG